MESFIKAVVAGFLIALMLFFAATIQGTILWLIYPHIHMLFNAPTILAKELQWWDAVCITWIFSILLKSSTTIKKND